MNQQTNLPRFITEIKETNGWWWMVYEKSEDGYRLIEQGQVSSQTEAKRQAPLRLRWVELRETVIKPFVISVINDATFRLGNNFLVHLDGQQLQQIDIAFRNPLGCPLGQQLDEIARASLGLIKDDEEGFNRGTVHEGIQGLMEQLFAPGGLGSAYHIPAGFWNDTPLGRMVRDAHVWSQRDELITQAQAAELRGVSVQAIHNAIQDGRLIGYTNPDAPTRQGRTLVSRQGVENM